MRGSPLEKLKQKFKRSKPAQATADGKGEVNAEGVDSVTGESKGEGEQGGGGEEVEERDMAAAAT